MGRTRRIRRREWRCGSVRGSAGWFVSALPVSVCSCLSARSTVGFVVVLLCCSCCSLTRTDFSSLHLSTPTTRGPGPPLSHPRPQTIINTHQRIITCRICLLHHHFSSSFVSSTYICALPVRTGVGSVLGLLPHCIIESVLVHTQYINMLYVHRLCIFVSAL